MEQSAVSHQLRLLRALGLVTGTRQGRSVVYSFYVHGCAGEWEVRSRQGLEHLWGARTL
jgi:DNA-binding transcriptional ArsR family regulator